MTIDNITVSLKSHLKPHIYRSLNYLSEDDFKVNYKRNVDEISKNRVINSLSKSGLNISDIKNKLYLSSLGESNELASYLGGSTVRNDHNEQLYITLLIMGVVIAVLLYKIHG